MEGRWTSVEVQLAELLRLGVPAATAALELDVNPKQIVSIQKRRGFSQLIARPTGVAASYAEQWEAVRNRQMGMAAAALDTIEEAIADRDVSHVETGEVDDDGQAVLKEVSRVSTKALRASGDLIRSLEKGAPKEGGGADGKALEKFLARMEEIAQVDADRNRPTVIDVKGV